MNIMSIVSVLVGIVSLVFASLSFVNGKIIKIRMNEITISVWNSLHQIRKINEELVLTISQYKKENKKDNIRIIRLETERQIRRISLFTNEKELVYTSLLWFSENAIEEDRQWVARPLKYGCYDRGAKYLASAIIMGLDSLIA